MNPDYSYIPERHHEIDARLTEWSRWVRVGWIKGKPSPVFLQYRSHAWQWEEPELVIPIDQNRAFETERMVQALPVKQRFAIRWAYVFGYIPVSHVRKKLGVTKEGLSDLINSGRDMLKNRLKY